VKANEKFGIRLLRFRRGVGVTQGQLAKLIGVSTATISMIERGERGVLRNSQICTLGDIYKDRVIELAQLRRDAERYAVEKWRDS
jgi:transcriptional regulator with XRE-family HTH domain